MATAENTAAQTERLHDAFAAALRATDSGDQTEIHSALHALDDVALTMGMRSNQLGMAFARRTLSKAGLC